MRGAQQGIALVLRIPSTVILEGAHFEALMFAHGRGRARPFVDVVAKMHGEIELFFTGHVSECREQTLIPALTRHECHVQRCGAHAVGRCRAETTDGTRRTAAHETIEVPAIGFESIDIDVHTVRELLSRGGPSFGHDVLELLIVGHFPVDGGAYALHTAIGFVGAGREARPEHAASGRGVTGGDAECKRILGETGP